MTGTYRGLADELDRISLELRTLARDDGPEILGQDHWLPLTIGLRADQIHDLADYLRDTADDLRRSRRR